MNGRNVLRLTIALSFLFILTSCTTEPEPEPEPPIVGRVSPLTIVIDPNLIPIIELAEDYIVFPTIPGAPEFEVDMVLVSPQRGHG